MTKPNVDNQSSQPLGLPLKDGLGPLPKCGAPNIWGGTYTADQMRAYAAEQVAAERERCVPDVDELAQHIRWLNGSSKVGAGRLAERLVDWLRSRA